MIISCFKDKTEVNNPFNQKVSEILERFKTDKNGIEEMRKLSGDDFQKAKVNLPIACFGGQFSKRSRNSIQKGSGLLTLDFDKLKDLDSKRKELESKPYIYSVFVSPSGVGLKALVKIPLTTDDKEYKKYYLALSKEIKGIDESGKDISRACFFSYDPKIYINEKATTWDKKHEEEKLKMPKSQKNNDYHLANRCLNIIRGAMQGERHTKILNASRLMGGYVQAEKIDYNEAVRLLEAEAYHKDPEDFQTNKKAVYDGLEDGMKNPLKDLEKELKSEESELKHGKIYYTLSDVEDEIEELYINGVQRGAEIGFQQDKFTIKLGATSYIYAAPFSGKSQIWFEILVNLSCNYGWSHAVFSPETGRASEIFIEIMECYARRDFYKTYNNQMTPEEKKKARDFVDRHFIVLDPKDQVFTIEDFYNYIDIIERVYNTKIHTTTADPFNEFHHDFSKDNNRQDMYIERMLGLIRRNAESTQRHNCIITHVQDQKTEKDSSGLVFYPVPTYRQVAGGQAWSRKGQLMLAVWRPKEGLKDANGFPYEKNSTVLVVQKSKPKGIGETGEVNLFYDAKRHSYYEEIGGTRHYAIRGESKERESVYEVPKLEYEDLPDSLKNQMTIEEFENEEPPF